MRQILSNDWGVAHFRARSARQRGGAEFFAVLDTNRWNKVRLLYLAARVAWLEILLRPDVIISTVAASGHLACPVGKMIRARTIWLESIANADEFSVSGQIVTPFSDLWMSRRECQVDEVTVVGNGCDIGGRCCDPYDCWHAAPVWRVVKAVDDWAGALGDTEVFGQILRFAHPRSEPLQLPRNVEWKSELEPAEVEKRCQ